MEHEIAAASPNARTTTTRDQFEIADHACSRGETPDNLNTRLGRVVCRLLACLSSELGIDNVLTEEYVEKVERLLEQTGAHRPGYLHDGPDNVEGHSVQP